MTPAQPTRSEQCTADRVPLRHDDSLQLVQSKVRGPVAFLNPTQAHYKHKTHLASTHDLPGSNQTPIGTTDAASPVDSTTLSAANIEYRWTSRDNRKGRHTLVTKSPSLGHTKANVSTPRRSTHWRSILQTMWLMITFYPVWDISWCVAYIFTLGSILWVINSLFVLLPLIKPSSTFHKEALVGGGISAFIGATIFEVGSLLLILEAVNENRHGCFGYAVDLVFEERVSKVETGNRSSLRFVPKNHACTHHHRNKQNLVGKPHRIHLDTPSKNDSWVWYPSWFELKTHYFHELGFIASLSQLFGATIFWISGFTALPGILDVLSPGLSYGIFWTPPIIGGTGFIISGCLFMIETQKRWWLPAPTVLGWHIGAWNLIGGIGFTLCPAFGYDTSNWAQYQASCSTFWGSWAFLIGSLIQLYESLEKTPVRVEAFA